MMKLNIIRKCLDSEKGVLILCGRFTLFTDYEQILKRFDVDVAFDEENYVPNFNVAPSQSVISIISDGSSNRLGTLRWGLI